MAEVLTQEYLEAELRSSMEDLRSELLAADAALFVQKPGVDKWSVRDVVCHLVDTELLIFQYRLNRMLTDVETPHFPDIDHARWELEHIYAGQDWAKKLQELESERSKTIAMVHGATQALFEREAHHEVHGTITMGFIADYCARHTRVHLNQIRRTLTEVGN